MSLKNRPDLLRLLTKYFFTASNQIVKDLRDAQPASFKILENAAGLEICSNQRRAFEKG
jgi:hypothetical protein